MKHGSAGFRQLLGTYEDLWAEGQGIAKDFHYGAIIVLLNRASVVG